VYRRDSFRPVVSADHASQRPRLLQRDARRVRDELRACARPRREAQAQGPSCDGLRGHVVGGVCVWCGSHGQGAGATPLPPSTAHLDDSDNSTRPVLDGHAEDVCFCCVPRARVERAVEGPGCCAAFAMLTVWPVDATRPAMPLLMGMCGCTTAVLRERPGQSSCKGAHKVECIGVGAPPHGTHTHTISTLIVGRCLDKSHTQAHIL